jgi:hypothetical protein
MKNKKNTPRSQYTLTSLDDVISTPRTSGCRYADKHPQSLTFANTPSFNYNVSANAPSSANALYEPMNDDC